MTGNRDRYGELIEDPPEDEQPTVERPRPTRKARIEELRRILRESRERREAQR
jgi:hypothetical protein